MEQTITRSGIFSRHVAMQFRLYSGLFFDLPYEHVNTAGTTLPLFGQFCKEELAKGTSPYEIVQRFFHEKLGIQDFETTKDRLFAMMRLVERQVVLFDAIEDATYHLTRELEGPGSLGDAIVRISEEGLQEELVKLLPDFGVRIVLTAHPTQFYTDHVLGILAQLREAIHANDVQEVQRLLLQLGRTRFKKRERPTPFDEARSVLWFMENVIYDVVPGIHARLVEATGDPLEKAVERKPTIELGFWPGGDRDGNPNVTAAITRRVGSLLHESLIGLYLRELETLQKRLTFDGIIEKLEAVRERLASRISPPIDAGKSLDTGLYCVDTSETGYSDSGELIRDLLDIRRDLLRDHAGLFVENLDIFMYRVRSFGFSFAAIDLRQDSRIITATVDRVLARIAPEAGAYASMDPAGKLRALGSMDDATFAGKAAQALEGIEDPVLRDSIEVFSAAREIQHFNGETGLHRFVISNTQNAANILEIRFLAVLAGWPPHSLPLDIVPLFETVEDLEQAREIMMTLWTLPLYREHLGTRNLVQHIMLGFSDGTKDGGYVTANWFIYKAKQALSGIAREQGIRVVFFDGRGGPPARGGGNTHKFYRSLGKDIEGRTIHLTVQGQTISSMYGHSKAARHNIEQLVSAVLDNNLSPHVEWNINKHDAEIMEELSGYAFDRYQSLKSHPDFLRFIQEVSPLSFYGQANISSRPTKRNSGSELKLDDLRAIPFVGAWSQLKLNISGYFGLGTALKNIIDQGRTAELQAFYRQSLFFRTLLENSMQSLSKVYTPLTAYLEKDKDFSSIRKLIGDEVALTKQCLLICSGLSDLLGNDIITKDSIRMREDLIIPITVIQQYALACLRKIRASSDTQTPAEQGRAEILKKLVIKSMATCINASRNSV